MTQFILLWILLLLDSLANASELVEFNTDVRALGMGNAYSAVVEDHYSLWYNPAGLSRVKGINLTIVGVQIGADGSDIVSVVNDTRSNNSYVQTLQRMYGRNIWVGAGGKTAVTLPGFGAAAFDTADVAAHLSNPAFPNINFRYTNDYGLTAGFAVDIVPQFFSFGLSGQRIVRAGAQFPIGVSTLATLSNQTLLDEISNSGTGYGATAGLLLGAPTPVSPRLSFVWKNMGQTVFTKDSGQRAPPPLLDEMVTGFSLQIKLPVLTITPAVDFKHINRYEEQLGKKIHGGVEFDFVAFSARGGFSQGYYTVGAGLNLGVVRVDLATYGVELGEYPGQQEDRRYLVSASIGLGFDPSGLFNGSANTGSGGSRSYLKPRR